MEHVIYSMQIFNETMMHGRSYAKPLGHIALIDHMRDKKNVITNMVIDVFKRGNWIEFYGLNFIETMNLDYGNFITMKLALSEHTKKIDEAAEAHKKKLADEQRAAELRSLKK